MRIDKQASPVNVTKLTPPRKDSDLLVDRAVLCTRIATRASQRLTVLVAPAGYGKTSVLAQVRAKVAGSNAGTGWLSLDQEDNDLGRFLLHFVEAIRGGGSLAGQATLALLRSGVSLPAAVLKATLMNEMAAIEKDTYLFIDDFHLISDRTVLATVQGILLAPLPNLHLLIATRDARALPLSQLRLRGELLELGVHDLQFSEIEIGDLFCRQNGTAISSELASLLLDRTEGWVAGLQFAAIALRDSADPDQFLARFSGQHRNVGDFLAEEVFGRQAADVQEFLLSTCLVKRFDTALSNAVTQRTDSRNFLDRLESANLFVFSLDSERRWYRYHHLFAEFLQRRLRERFPDRFVEIHRLACHWLAENGLAVDAIEHAFSAGDEELAAGLLDSVSSHLFANGQSATTRAYAARLSPSNAARCPQLQLDLAWDSVLHWQFVDARNALENARATLEHWAAEPERSRSSQLEFLMAKLAHREMMLCLLSDDVVGTRERCEKWLASSSVVDPLMRGSTQTALMLCNRESYLVDGAAAATERLHELFVKSGAVYGTAFHNSIAGTWLFAAGNLAQAQDVYNRGREWAIRLQGEKSSLAAMPSMLLAELLYERNDLAEARRLIDESFAMSRELGFVDNLIAGFITCSRLDFIDRDRASADAILDDATHFADHYGFDRLRVQVLCERIRQLLLMRETRDAVHLLSEALPAASVERLAPSSQASSKNEILAITYARVCCETGKEEAALPLIKSWLAYTRGRRCTRSVVRLAVLLAKLSVRGGNRQAALRYLIEALEVGSASGFVRSFLDEGEAITDLLSQMDASNSLASTPAREAAGMILAFARDANTRSAVSEIVVPATATAAPEALSQREIEILVGDN